MSAYSSPQTGSGLLADVLQATKQLHRTDTRCRYAIEIGAIGFILMVGMSLFGGGSAQGGVASPPPASYNPPPQATASAPATSGAPTVTQSQIQAIKQQAGGGNVISTVPIAPRKIAPAVKLDDANLQAVTEEDASFGKLPGKKK